MQDSPLHAPPSDTPTAKSLSRRRFIQTAAAGTVITTLGGLYTLSDCLTSEARADVRGDGRPRLPPGQRLIQRLKPMGGSPGEPELSRFRLRLHGEVDAPIELDYRALLAMGPTEQSSDVHCVTGWSVFDAMFEGVTVSKLARLARVKASARYVIFEAAHGYTSNLPLREAMAPNVLVTWRLDGRSLPRAHGGPMRVIAPDLYFWKSAKWLTGIRFTKKDEPGYWETRGYHNHADPWHEERYS